MRLLKVELENTFIPIYVISLPPKLLINYITIMFKDMAEAHQSVF